MAYISYRIQNLNFTKISLKIWCRFTYVSRRKKRTEFQHTKKLLKPKQVSSGYVSGENSSVHLVFIVHSTKVNFLDFSAVRLGLSTLKLVV